MFAAVHPEQVLHMQINFLLKARMTIERMLPLVHKLSTYVVKHCVGHLPQIFEAAEKNKGRASQQKRKGRHQWKATKLTV